MYDLYKDRGSIFPDIRILSLLNCFSDGGSNLLNLICLHLHSVSAIYEARGVKFHTCSTLCRSPLYFRIDSPTLNELAISLFRFILWFFPNPTKQEYQIISLKLSLRIIHMKKISVAASNQYIPIFAELHQN